MASKLFPNPPAHVPKELHDFRNFLFVIWKHLGLPDPTPVQYDIADYLQTGPKRLMVQAFRGVGKSYVTSAFACWCWLMNPDYKILIVSASRTRSDDFSTFTQRLIMDVPLLQHLRAKGDQRWSKVSFDVGPAQAAHSPSCKSLGITSALAGSRADLIIADDIEVMNNSDTELKRDKLAEAVKEFDAILKPDGRICYLGTPQNEQSTYKNLPERGYSVRIWPARYPETDKIEKYGNTLAPFILNAIQEDATCNTGHGLDGSQGKTTDPLRFDEQDLIERELSYGRSGFALQFQLDTSLSDAERYPLKVADLMIMSLNPDEGPEKVIWGKSPDLMIKELPNVALNGDYFHRPVKISDDWVEYQGSVMAIDPSGRGGDETGYAIVKNINSQLYVTACGGMKGGYDESTFESLAKMARDHKVNMIIVEGNFGDGMWSELFSPYLQRIYPVTLEEVKHSTQKERRIIDTLEPVMNQKRLIIDYQVIQDDYDSTRDMPPEKALRYQLIYQLTRVTHDRGSLSHDDRLDALAIAVAYWVEQMGTDVDIAVKLREEELFQNELDRFMDHALGVDSSDQYGDSLFGIRML